MSATTRGSSRAERVYGRLLATYPAEFRARFEAGMRHAFAREHADARAAGWSSHAAFWIITAAQAVAFGLAARRRPRSAPSPSGSPMRSWLTFDTRDALRSLRATPIVTVMAVLSLALGIGATTALFSILNSLVFKTLPVREPSRLVVVDDGGWTNSIWEAVRARHAPVFDAAFAWSATRFDLSEHGQTDYVAGAYASGEIFDVLGVRAVRGRVFTPADDNRSGGPDGPVAVVSEQFWHDRLEGGADVIGRHITLNRTSFTIVGVIPADFFGPDVGRRCAVIVPLGDAAIVDGNTRRLDNRSIWWLDIMARLKPGQSMAQAAAALNGVRPQIREATLPAGRPPNELATYLAAPFKLVSADNGVSSLRSKYRDPLVVLLIVVGTVLLIACANIANLLLARAAARRRELSLRLALGASSGRLARQFFLESLILAGAGAIAGLLVAEWGGRLLVYQISRDAFLDLAIDGRVLGFTSGVAIITAVLFGFAPMLTTLGLVPSDALKDQGRGMTGDRRHGVRNALVVAQVALSVALVVAAGLFIRTFSTLASTSLGFTPDPLSIVTVNTRSSHVTPDAQPAEYERLRQAVASIPGVASASTSVITPVGNAAWNTLLELPGLSLPEKQRLPWVNAVSPGWFATYGMRMMAGRDFDDRDRKGSPRITIVNETFVRRYLTGTAPIGAHVHAGLYGGPNNTRDYEIVGVVSDAVYRSLKGGFEPTIYVPLAQSEDISSGVEITVRAAGGQTGALSRAIVAAIARVEPADSLTFATLVEQIRSATSQPRLIASLSAFFGGLALLLAALGLYGVTAYSVSSRRSEIGIRMALGAHAAGVIRLILGRVWWLVGAGVLAGGALSWWASRYLTALLFGVEPRDPMTFVVAAIVLLSVGTMAGWLPARRASRIDPALVLRE